MLGRWENLPLFHFLMKHVNFARPPGKFELFLGNNTSQKFPNQTSNFPVIQVLNLKIMTPLRPQTLLKGL